MAEEDKNFCALLNSLLSIGNDERTKAEVRNVINYSHKTSIKSPKINKKEMHIERERKNVL